MTEKTGTEVWVKPESKLIKSVTSCHGHLAKMNLQMYHSSVNTCQNQVKLCTLKVQDDVQLVNIKILLVSQDCQSHTSFKDFTIKGLGQKILT